MQPSGHIRFAVFDLDLDTKELRRRGRLVKLSPKPFQLLHLLAASPGRLVTREAIRKELWDSDTFVDFEHALNFCIREVRTALGDRAQNPKYIETLPRRGYRFIAETVSNGSDPKPATAPVADEERRLEAYRHYENGRKWFGQAGKEALEQASVEFSRAVEILPTYALAHSGLGAARALRSLNRRDPADLSIAKLHLKRALELDPELAEPYPWLCYVHMRTNRLDAAIQAGLRGVQLQPDLVHAHYFLGLAYFGRAEVDAANYENAERHLLDAGRTNPLWQATWFVLAYLGLMTGDYRKAEEHALRLLELGRAGKGLPFIGAEIVLATVKLRQGAPDNARVLIEEFLNRMAESDHMYRDAMSAAAACVLGDIELRYGEPGAALAAYRRAWHTVQEHPRIAAYQRTAARAQAGLAAAYAAGGDHTRGAELFDRALHTARESESSEHAAAAASMGELYWTLAVAASRLNHPELAREMLQSAIRTGWRDLAWMNADPELSSISQSLQAPRTTP